MTAGILGRVPKRSNIWLIRLEGQYIFPRQVAPLSPINSRFMDKLSSGRIELDGMEGVYQI